MLEAVEIEGFRMFDSLRLGELRRVNVIIGGNNSGKTSLLEALAALTAPSNLLVNCYAPFRKDLADKPDIYWAQSILASGTRLVGRADDGRTERIFGDMSPYDVSWAAERQQESLPGGINSWYVRSHQHLLSSMAVGLEVPSSSQILQDYGEASKQNVKRKLVDHLQKIDARLVDIEILPERQGVFSLYVENEVSGKLPLALMGQGFLKAFGLYCRLLSSPRRIALIDEIEAAMHHESLPTLWQAVKLFSDSENLQLFVTTHSYECMEAAWRTYGSDSSSRASFQFIRLDRDKAGKVTPVYIRDEVIDTALRNNHELR